MIKAWFKFSPALPCPCHGCERRAIGCHDECEAYRAFRKELDALNAKARQERSK